MAPQDKAHTPGDPARRKASRTLPRRDVQVAVRAVLRLIDVPLTNGQYDALVSFTFNLGGVGVATTDVAQESESGGAW